LHITFKDVPHSTQLADKPAYYRKHSKSRFSVLNIPIVLYCPLPNTAQ